MLNGQLAIVTGASRGIGRAIATSLAETGAEVACVATTEPNAQATVDVIVAAGGKAAAYALDVSRSEDVTTVFDRIMTEHGTPAILVNNAGITKDTLMMRMADEDWQRVLDVNLSGSYFCTKAVMRSMMKARYGRIINISSVVGLHGAAGQANYAASKAGLVGLTLATAKELGSRGITCNAVAPGFIATDMTVDLPEEMRADAEKRTPAGRLGEPGDIAAAVLFLASPSASFITGQVLTVDGGLFL